MLTYAVACCLHCSSAVTLLRYLVNQPDDAGPPSQFPQYTTITQNMMVANYQSQEAVDNDDGSGFYHTHHNFLVYGHYGMF